MTGELEVRLDGRTAIGPADLRWSEHFVPLFKGQHLHAHYVLRV